MSEGRAQAEIKGPRLLLPDEGQAPGHRRRGGAAEKQGWRLLSEDIKRGRLFALVGLVFMLAAAVSFATSPEYIVQSVTVEGSEVLSLEQANEIAGVAGRNIFTIDPAEVRSRLADEAALLKGVTVETRLPNEVIIRVLERKPAVVWVIGDGTPMLASDDNVVVGHASTLDGFVTIFDRGPMTDTFTVGQPMPVHKADATETAQQIYMMLPAATGVGLRQLEWAPDNGVTAITAEGQRIEFGTGDEMERKIKIVQSVVQDSVRSGKTWSVLDVRSVDRPSIKR